MAPSERNNNSVPSLTAKSNANNNADVVIWADPATHALLVTVSGISGSLSNNNAAPGATNLGVLSAVASAAAPSYTEGYQVLLSTDLAGALRVTGSLSVGGTTDNSAFTAGTSTGTPAMGFYHSTVDSVTDGRSAVIGMTTKRAMFVSLYDASGNALLGQKTMAASVPVVLASDQASIPVAATLAAETTKVIGTTRTVGNVGAVFDGVNTAATAPANGVLTLGIYNSTEPSPTTGQSVGIQLDAKGRTRGVIMDAAGNTRGANVNASNQLSVSVDNTVTVASHAVTVASGGVASGAIASGAFASGSIAAGAVAAGASSFVKLEDTASADADAGVPAMAIQKATPADTAGTDGDYAMLQMSAGRLWTTSNVDKMNGVTVLMGNGVTGTGSQRVTLASDNSALPAWGHGATAAAVPAGATYNGLMARTTNPSAATDGNMVGASADKLGRQVVVIGNVRDLKGNQFTTITSSTSETTVVTAVASTFLDVYGVIVENTSATASKVTFKDSTAGTTQFEIYVPAGDTRGLMLASSDGYKQTTVNNNWTATCGTSVASIVISVQYVKNI